MSVFLGSSRFCSVTFRVSFNQISRQSVRFIQQKGAASLTMEAVKQTIAQNFGGPAHKAAPESQQFALEQVPSLTGKVAVVTGGSEGTISHN